MIGVGDVLAVRTAGWAARLINVGAALRGHPAMDNHVVICHHKDSTGQWWGLEGKPGGVGQVTLDRYLSSPYTVNNCGQPRSEQQRYDVAVAAEALLATQYDWVGIARDGLEAIGAPRLWSDDWHGQGPPGHVVCSSYAAWLYEHVGLDAPVGQRSVTPADWTDFSLTHRFNTTLGDT